MNKELTLKEIEEIQKRHREELKENRDRLNARKKRTHHLIVRGTIAESFIDNAEDMTDEEFREELEKALNYKETVIIDPVKE